MTDTAQTPDPSSGPVLAADGSPLKRSLARALRLQKTRALLLIAPLLVFVLISFIVPIGTMLFRSVENEMVAQTLPNTVPLLAKWDASTGELPDEAVFAAMAADMKVAIDEKTHTRLGSRLNYEHSGMSSLFRQSGRKIKRWDIPGDAPFKEKFLDAHDGWGDMTTWRVIQTHSGKFTNGYFLNAIDMQKTPDGPRAQPENKRVLIQLFIRTLVMSLTIMGACILLGYPVAWLLANLPARKANMLMILVLLPFWTSLLVRTSAWKVMLQQQGVINDVLVWIGLVADDNRLVMINNQFGTITAMTHILLPFMILPMYSVMQTINPSYLRAAKSPVRRDQLDRILAGLFSAIRPRHRGRVDPGLHLVDRLLHHARNRRRNQGRLHLEPDCLSHLKLAQLGPCGRVGDDPAGRRSGPILVL